MYSISFLGLKGETSGGSVHELRRLPETNQFSLATPSNTQMRHRSYQTQSGKGKRLKFPLIKEVLLTAAAERVETRSRRCSHMASQTSSMETTEARLPWLPEVMAAIATCQLTLSSKIEAVQLDVGLIRQDLVKLQSRVTKTEQRIGQMKDEVMKHSPALHRPD